MTRNSDGSSTGAFLPVWRSNKKQLHSKRQFVQWVLFHKHVWEVTGQKYMYNIQLQRRQSALKKNTWKTENCCLSCLPLPTDPEGAMTSSSLSSSFDCVTSGSGATFLTSCSCSTLLRKAKIRWCNAAYNCPVSLELAYIFLIFRNKKKMQGITTE